MIGCDVYGGQLLDRLAQIYRYTYDAERAENSMRRPCLALAAFLCLFKHIDNRFPPVMTGL